MLKQSECKECYRCKYSYIEVHCHITCYCGLGIEPQRNEMCLMYTPDFPWEEEPARIRGRRYHALMSNNMHI